MVWYDIWYGIWHDMTRYNTKRRDAARYNNMIRYDTIHDTIRYDTIWYDMIWYNIIYNRKYILINCLIGSCVRLYFMFKYSHYYWNIKGMSHLKKRICSVKLKNTWISNMVLQYELYLSVKCVTDGSLLNECK